jgi:hypothetical protein
MNCTFTESIVVYRSDATLATRPWQVSPPIDPRWQMEIGDRFMDCISQHEMPLFQAEEKLGRD